MSRTCRTASAGRRRTWGVPPVEPSGGPVDADLDRVQAIRLAPRFLPHTDLRFGRPGSPNLAFPDAGDPLGTAGHRS